jgi:maltose O-acetyltransferase
LWLLRAAGIHVGEGVRIRAGFRFLIGRVRLEDDVFISDACYFEDHAQIAVGARTWIGAHTRLVTATHAIGPPQQRAGEWRAEPINIGRGCWLGTGVTVLSGVTIGDGCVFGAGALVLRDCEPNGLYLGVPASRRKDL